MNNSTNTNYAAISTDGTRPVVWGLGSTEEEARAEAAAEASGWSSGGDATVAIPASVADRIRAGEVSCEALGIVVEVRDGEVVGATYPANTVRYEVQIEHTDAPSWLVAPRVVVGARDEPHARLTVETTWEDAEALETALDDDDFVGAYNVTSATAGGSAVDLGAAPEGYRVFQGGDTNQVDASGGPAVEGAWYWEPEDYTGDVLWAAACGSEELANWAAYRGAARERS